MKQSSCKCCICKQNTKEIAIYHRYEFDICTDCQYKLNNNLAIYNSLGVYTPTTDECCFCFSTRHLIDKCLAVIDEENVITKTKVCKTCTTMVTNRNSLKCFNCDNFFAFTRLTSDVKQPQICPSCALGKEWRMPRYVDNSCWQCTRTNKVDQLRRISKSCTCSNIYVWHLFDVNSK